jgi:predicted DNA-binding transcriptional regulator AlpA
MDREQARHVVRTCVRTAYEDDASEDADQLAGAAIEALEALPDLVGRSQAAEILQVGTTNIDRQFPDLPEPERRIGSRPVWRRSTIEAYAAQHTAAQQQ